MSAIANSGCIVDTYDIEHRRTLATLLLILLGHISVSYKSEGITSFVEYLKGKNWGRDIFLIT